MTAAPMPDEPPPPITAVYRWPEAAEYGFGTRPSIRPNLVLDLLAEIDRLAYELWQARRTTK